MLKVGFNIGWLGILGLLLIEFFDGIWDEVFKLGSVLHGLLTDDTIDKEFRGTLEEDVDVLVEILVRVG